MKSLSDFYETEKEFLNRLDESKEEINFGSPLYQKAEVAEPIVIKDNAAIDLFRFITMFNGHFVPNRKPGIGLCTGDYVLHADKNYITGLLGVAQTNSFVIHIARSYEQTIDARKGFEKIRPIINVKSVPCFESDKITLNAPTASGGSSWIQISSSKIIDSVPTPNNLLFYASHAGKLPIANMSTIGGGLSVEKSITFIVPGGLLQKIQKIVDKHTDLVQIWEEYKFDPKATIEENKKRSFDWNCLINERIKIEAIKEIKKSINNEVLGIQCDISNCPEICRLRPVITEAYAHKSIRTLKDKGITEVLPVYKKFVLDGGDKYYSVD